MSLRTTVLLVDQIRKSNRFNYAPEVTFHLHACLFVSVLDMSVLRVTSHRRLLISKVLPRFLRVNDETTEPTKISQKGVSNIKLKLYT